MPGKQRPRTGPGTLTCRERAGPYCRKGYRNRNPARTLPEPLPVAARSLAKKPVVAARGRFFFGMSLALTFFCVMGYETEVINRLLGVPARNTGKTKRRTRSGTGASPPTPRAMEGSLMMQVEAIKQSDLTQSEREVLKEDAARWKRMGAGSHLDDWLSYFPGLAIRRRLAMRLAFTNKPEG